MKKFFGQFQYTAPVWLKAAMAYLAQTNVGIILTKFWNSRIANPKLFYKKIIAGVLALGLITGGGVVTYKWWQARPRPEVVTFKIQKPFHSEVTLDSGGPLNIIFSKSVARLEDINTIIKDKVVMEPAISGTWSWQTDSNLLFIPDPKTKADWLIGTKYSVELKKSLFADHIRLEKYSDIWTSAALVASVIGSEFYIDPKDPRIKKVVVQLNLTHPIRLEDLEEKISVSIAAESGVGSSSKINHTVTFNKVSTVAYIHTETLAIEDRPQVVIVKLEKGLKPKQPGQKSESSLETKVDVPGRLTAFKVESSSIEIIRNQKYEPEQILLVKTTLQARSEDVAKKLNIKLLPKNKPAQDGEKEIKDYQWSGASEVTDDIMKLATEVKFILVPSENEFSKVHSFRISTNPKQYVWLQLEKGLKSLGDFELAENYTNLAEVKPYPEEVSVMSEGSLLSLSGELKVPLMARNAKAVEISLSRVRPEQVNHLLSQISYDITKPYLDYNFENKTSERFSSVIQLNLESAKATQFFSFDLSSYLIKNQSPKGIFILKATIVHPDKSYGPSDQRLIMVTDMGLIVKETQTKTHEVFVQNIRSGLPAAAATIEVIGKNGLAVLSVVADAQGHAIFPNLKDFQREKEPIAFSVRSGGDQSFLPYQNSKQNLQYSRFDVGGLYESAQSDQMMSMIFSDRGIYRPGESVNLGLIVRSKTTKLKGQKIPLQLNVRDPKGNDVLTQKILINSDDYKSAEFKTEETAPTGIYEVSLNLIKKDNQLEPIGSQTVRIEEFQPDRIKIRSSLSQEKLSGWLKVQDLKGFVSLKNLFGTAAEDRLVRAKVVLAPQQPSFKGFEGYKFIQFDQSQIQAQTEELNEARTNAKGEAEFALNLNRYSSPYFLARFEAEGFEADAGRSVKASSSVILSTLDFMVGAKPDGDLDYIHKGTEHFLNLIAIDSNLKKILASDLILDIIERKYVSVLTQSSSGDLKYQSVLKEIPVSTSALKIPEAGSKYSLKTDLPGDFFLVIKNKENVELLKLPYTIAGAANIARSLDRHAELQLILNKKDFRVGEDIELQIKAPYKGAGLISIERDGIYQFKWFKSETSATVQKIKVPEGLTGNAYIHVTFLRAIDSSEIFMSPLSYAVAPFSISLEDHKANIELNIPEKIKPGQKLKILYSTKVPTQLILYGVDEGILQVARYKLPDPLGYFFQKRALQVKTYQMLDLIMPEFSLIQQSQAPGGDEASGALGKNINPFRSKRSAPIAFWSGVLSSGPKAKSYTYDVPDYFNGNIKVMAVAADSKNLGSAESSTFVRGDFIISPSVPVFIAPLDEMVVGISVSNQKEKSGANATIKLTTKSNALLEITKNAEQTLQIDEGKEVSTSISVKAKNLVGEGELTFTAQFGATAVKAKSDLSVRPLVAYQNKIITGWSQSWPLELGEATPFYEPFSKKIFTASGSPLALSFGLQNYLESQPYGCTEQLVSKVFPSVALFNYYDKNKKQSDKMKESITSLVRILRARQMADGGFSLYENLSGRSHPAASLHGILILIELNERKLSDVNDLLKKAKVYLTAAQVSPSVKSISGYRIWAQALYLAARLKVVNGASLSALKQELNQLFKDEWSKDLTALFIAGTSRLYKQDEQAENLFKGFKIEGFSADEKNYDFTETNYFDSLSKNALLIYLSALHAGESYKKIVETKNWNELAGAINSGLHTFSASYLLLAFEAMEQRNAALPVVNELKIWGIAKTWELLPPKQTGHFNIWSIPIATEKVQLNSNSNFPLFYAYQNSGFASDAKVAEAKEKIEVNRQYFNQAGKVVTEVKIGEEIDVSLAIRSTDSKEHSHVAIVDLLPGGFELIPQRDLNRLDSGSSDSPEGEVTPQNTDQMDNPEVETPAESEEGAYFKFPWNHFISKAYAQVSTAVAFLDYDFVDQRDDRVVVYGTVIPDIRYFKYKIKAVAQGHFQIPPAFAEGMYDRSLRFVGPSGWIEIKSDK
ncbi:MAG: alpha-2-macroglobulin [Pseudobdellovibrio sp.]